ncbi:hypothetical protein RRF57_011666 [Xylaria bambusicola]|uniref:Uncharacterized protein n=1 Tax=Xylaria bambusicola TaxID=326684 RepID=A0AAN7V301_9PEZI
MVRLVSGPCDPAIIEQEYNNALIAKLRALGSSNVYVSTTTLYSGFFDEIAEIQQGTATSAYLGDSRGAGATNVELQSACKGYLGGTFYCHAGVLFSLATAAMVKDALTHDGPGKLSRVHLDDICVD